MRAHVGDTRLVVADLSGKGGGESKKWHRSHQSGRDVDLVYYVRDADGKPFEADAMRAFDATGKARDGSGVTIDIPRTWLLVKELVTAHEATVQYMFIYEPIAVMLLAHAVATGEPEALIARARQTLQQPGDSAPHHDHMHVRDLLRRSRSGVRLHRHRPDGAASPSARPSARARATSRRSSPTW